MSKVPVALYFEINGIAHDEDGNPSPAGMKLSIGEIDEEKLPPYEELTKNLNVPELLKMCFLENTIRPEQMHVITPEKYEELYAEDDEESDAEGNEE